MSQITVAAIQRMTLDKTEENLEDVKKHLAWLKEEHNPDIVLLPEMFTCPYHAKNFPSYAQEDGGSTWQAISEMARENEIYLVAGSVPERAEGDAIYNTSYVFDRQGNQIGKHRKVHLFDIDVKGGQYFKESDTLTAGDRFTTFETEFGTMGLCICYDIRFPEIFRIMVDRGAKMVFVPAAFNPTTGPAHWELTHRARALDNQIFVLACSPAMDESSTYLAYGHSILTNPWGEVVAQLEEAPGLIVETVDLSYPDEIREQLPLLKHRRKDLYELVVK